MNNNSKSTPGKELYLEAVPVHFTVYGNQILADHLFETLTNLRTP